MKLGHLIIVGIIMFLKAPIKTYRMIRDFIK